MSYLRPLSIHDDKRTQLWHSFDLLQQRILRYIKIFFDMLLRTFAASKPVRATTSAV